MSRYLKPVTILMLLIALTLLAVSTIHAQTAWAPNVAYATGQLVTYGGSVYKCVQGHTSQTGWEPPNLPALWSLQSGGGTVPTNTKAPPTKTSTPGGTVPTKTNTPSSGCSGFTCVVSEQQFNAWFPNRNGLYTYANFLTARGSYSGFAGSADLALNKREAAAFFAHVAHETSYLYYIREINQSVYCAGGAYGCAAGQSYFGRGPLQLTWNYNYKMAATGNYLQNGTTWVNIMTPSVGSDIWSNPDIVATNGIITWKTALWYWMNHGKDWDPAQPTVHADIVNIGFGETTRDINGGLECGQAAGSVGYSQMTSRANIYSTFLSNLGVSDTRSKTC
jgi:predicted chitinase